MSSQVNDRVNRSAIFWISVLALFIAAFSNAIRIGVSEIMRTDLLAPIDPVNSGAMIGAVLGNSFLGFAISLLIISPLVDRIGGKNVILFAAFCYIVGPLLVLAAAVSGGDSVFLLLKIAMVIWGCGWGATEASINPLAAALYPQDKTGKLNSLHAWWPAGIIVGSLLSLVPLGGLNLDWKAFVAIPIVPGIILAIWTLRHKFPVTESTALGVSFSEMMAEPFKRPTFWVFFAIMFLTASAELAPGAWVEVALSQTIGMPGILVLVYVSAIMFIMRHFAGALEHKFSDMGLLLICTVPAAIGLYLLSVANSPFTAIVAATFWAFGVCFMWPTMLASVARRYPQSGPWGIGLIGFAGALAIYFVLPQLGKIYDAAKIEKAGGAEAFDALAQGSSQLHDVLAYAAAVSFQKIAIIPVILFVIFALVWFVERRRKSPLGAPVNDGADV